MGVKAVYPAGVAMKTIPLVQHTRGEASNASGGLVFPRGWQPILFGRHFAHVSHEALVGLVLLGVMALGAVVLFVIRKKASAWADQYDKAAENEARGLEGDYPVIGFRARRLSNKEAMLLLAGVLALVTAIMFLPWT